jgi:hypothetical protein
MCLLTAGSSNARLKQLSLSQQESEDFSQTSEKNHPFRKYVFDNLEIIRMTTKN